MTTHLRRQLLPSSLLALAFLLACGGCYNPKPDIEAFRPHAQKQLDALAKAGKLVEALPPLEQDYLMFADSRLIDFTGGTTLENNATMVMLEQLTTIGKPSYSRGFAYDDFYGDALGLLNGTDRYGNKLSGKLTKQMVAARFHGLLKIKYLMVVRATKKVEPTLTALDAFKSGEQRGEVYLCELNDAATLHGGFLYAARNTSGIVNALVHTGAVGSGQTDRESALREDLDKQTLAVIHQKIKTCLPQATVFSDW